MSTYKPGYIEGKIRLGVYVDEDVRKALRIRAAETGESMSDIAERALRRELGMVDRISVINPGTGAWKYINRSEVTPEKLEAMAVLMEDDIREDLHRECPDDPGEFFARYVERVGPERAGEVWFA